MKWFYRYIVFLLLQLVFFNVVGQEPIVYKGDTINNRDEKNQKTGIYIFFFDNDKKQIKETGSFQNNRKLGLWVSYFKNGNRKSEITYQNGKPIGPSRFYYENGNIQEEGIWHVNRWIGSYKYYHENGNLSYEFEFNKNGKRTGNQYYYYETGELMISGEWKNGKEADKIIEYYKDGTVKNEKIFLSGKYQQGQSRDFVKGEKDGGETVKRLSKKFNITGNYKKRNKDSLLIQRGYFENGILIRGEWYLYDVNGKRYETRKIENKKVINVIEH